MLKYVLTVIVLLLLWAASFVFRLPLWIPILSSITIVAFLVLYVIWRRLKEKKAEKRIEAAINSQAEEDANDLRPGKASEIRTLQAEFNRALQSLRSSRLARGGKNALAALPWYLMIGPPGAGKSTALKNCGLKFPNISGTGRGGGMRGIGGTRNCEWWMTNQAILLDTAGRYTTEDDDREEWLSFLDMLRSTRPRKPVNGILVGISITDLMEARTDEVIEKARQVRDRIDEAMERLHTVVPVYVLFTKCDLVSGFVESFGSLRKKERGQVWGFTLPLDSGGMDTADLFHEHFDELVAALESRTLARMAEPISLEMREKVFAFPQELDSLRANLGDFVNELFVENIYKDVPILRGVYFTSGTQEGTPIDRIMGKVGEAFGVRRKASAPAPAAESKSYFLLDLMTQIVFPDQDVAFSNKRHRRRTSLGQWLFAAGSAALAGLGLWYGYAAYRGNRELVEDTLAMAQKAISTGEESGLTIADLTPLGARIEMLNEHRKNGAPWALRFGMYQGSALTSSLTGLYSSAIRQTVFDPVMAQDLDDMERFTARFTASNLAPDAREFVRLFDKLKLHLLLTKPKAEGEPEIGESEQTFIMDAVSSRQRRAAAKKDVVVREHVRVFLRLLQEGGTPGFVRSEDVVKRTRQILRRTRLDKLVLEKLIADLNKNEFNIGLQDLLGYGASCLKSQMQIRGAFTKRAWEKKVRGRLAKAGEIEDRWVLGAEQVPTDSTQAGEQQAADLRAQYLQQYRDEWRRFIDSIQVKTASTGPEALALLQEVTDSKPFVTLAEEIAKNVHLEDLSRQLNERAKGLVGKVRDKLGLEDEPEKPKPKTEDEKLSTLEDLDSFFSDFVRFVVPPKDEAGTAAKKAPPMDLIQEHLEYVRDDLKAYLDGEGKDSGPVENRIKVARLRLESLLQAAGPKWRPRYSAWLTPLLDITVDIVKGVGGSAANGKWCTEIYQPYMDVVANRYPFVKAAEEEIQISTFSKFYSPTDGKIWKYYEAEWKTKLEPVGDRFVLKDNSGTYSGQLAAFFARSRAITSSIFPEGAAKPNLRFAVQLLGVPGVSEVSFEVDGNKLVYRNGPLEWKNAAWPGEGQRSNAAIRIKGTGIDEYLAFEGEWALFRLLDQAVLREEGTVPNFSATWSLKNKTIDVRVLFRPAQRDNPFVSLKDDIARYQLLRSFRSKDVLPAPSIAKGAKCE
jgi:type VI secretion system protein ImpL